MSVRASLGEASPRDLAVLRDGLLAGKRATTLLEALEAPAERETLGLAVPVDCVEELQAELDQALVERPSPLAKEGEIFQRGYDTALTELEDLRQGGRPHHG